MSALCCEVHGGYTNSHGNWEGGAAAFRDVSMSCTCTATAVAAAAGVALYRRAEQQQLPLVRSCGEIKAAEMVKTA